MFEWLVLAYTAFTLLLMAFFWGRLVNPAPMLLGRVGVVAMTLVLWQVYRRWPSRLTLLLRVAGQLCVLGWWYPDTYEFNRLLPNLDHVFAGWEQALFGCQPALLFAQNFSSPVLSELLCLGYFSYYPLIAAVSFYYFWKRPERLDYAIFVILGSFFLFYVIFIFLPVAGPQFYFEAVGVDQIAAGHFPDMGHYFLDHQAALPIPGAEGGLFHDLVQQAHNAGERPTAAFPSSHVGVTVVLLWLAWEKGKVTSSSCVPSVASDQRSSAVPEGAAIGLSRPWGLIIPVAVLFVLMFFATFYIQAHYAIDAIAGLFTGTAMYFVLRWAYGRAERSARRVES